MVYWQILFSAVFVCNALHQGLSATAGSISLLTITPGADWTTPEPCPALPCPAPPQDEICSSMSMTYFEYHGMLCPGCNFCIVEPTTGPTAQ